MHLKLHDDVLWIISHAWSMRFTTAATLLAGLQVALPLLFGIAPVDPYLFAIVIFLVVVAAQVSRVVAQKHPAPDSDKAIALPQTGGDA
jgi:hypothetical protein